MPEGYTEIDEKLTRGVTKAKSYVIVKNDSYDSEEEFKEPLINFAANSFTLLVYMRLEQL